MIQNNLKKGNEYKFQRVQDEKDNEDILFQRTVNVKQNDQKLPFSLLVKFFVKMSNLRGLKKGNYCRQFIKIIFKNNRQPNFVYSILRLILPNDDRDRGNYGLKQKGLAKIITDTLGLSKEQYQRLYHYKNPNFHHKGFGIGDFSLCVYDISKSFCKQRSDLSVSELNLLLDQLSTQNESYLPILRQIYQKSNAEQIKWIIRIILKDLKLGIKIESVLISYHKDCYDFFNLTNSLLQVCKKFQNINISLSDEIKVFSPIRSMLAGKKDISYFKHFNNLFYLQTKYDGERIQAHWNGKDIKLFSRNSINYTHVYKEIVDLLAANLSCDACILDGEVIVLHKQTLQMVPFGMNKVVALSNTQNNMQLCYKIFDILWLQVQKQQMNMMKFTLKDRKNILQKVFKQIQGRLQLVSHKVVSEYNQILKQFAASIQRNEEGIMLKNPESLYLPKERSTNWLKLKGDYIDGLTDSIELLIIGGYFGDKSYRQGESNHWTDRITTFVLGIIEKDEDQDQDYIIIPFCKVGTGYSGQELKLLRYQLRDNFVIDDGKMYPPKLKNWKYSIQDKPDCWVKNFQKSIILQIKAAQIITSQSYPTNSTLRFPRVIKIRYDKNWDEGLTLSKLNDMKNNHKYRKNLQKIKQRSDSDKQYNNQEKKYKKIKTQNTDKNKNTNVILDDFKSVNLQSKDLKRSNLFFGLQFVVLNLIEGEWNRHHVEKQILLNGGKVSQNPLQSTNYIVSDHVDFRLNVYKNANLANVYFIKPKYIFNCLKLQTILPIIPLYLTCLPQKNRNFFLQNFDRFSDSYITYLNLKQLDEIVAQISDQINYKINKKLIETIQIRHRRQGKKSFCIGLKKLDLIRLKMNGNEIVDQLLDSVNLYSIIVNEEPTQQEKKLIDAYLIRNLNTIIETKEDLKQISIL